MASLVCVERIAIECRAGHLEAVEVCRVKLLKGTDKRLHVELCIHFVATNISKANLDLIAKFCSLLFCLGDTSFVALGKLDLNWLFGAALWWAPQSSENFEEPTPIDMEEIEAALAVLYAFNPAVGLHVPIVCDWASEDLNPELFAAVRVELC